MLKSGLVLLVDGDISFYRAFSRCLGSCGIEDVVYSADIQNALGIIEETDTAKVSLVVLACCLEKSPYPNAMPIVRVLIQKGYTGKILAYSADISKTEEFSRDGHCDVCEKCEVMNKTIELLSGLTS
jgi:hypothetical protein